MLYKRISLYTIAFTILSFSAISQEVTNYEAAKNFFIPITGIYPSGYEPKWKYIGTREVLNFQKEDYVTAKQRVVADQLFIALGEVNDKMALSFSAFINCDCMADLSIREGTKFTLSSTPHKFKLINFRKMTDGTPCANAGNGYFGGYDGSITLSASANGDILMDLTLQSYRRPSRVSSSGISYIWRANNVRLPNLMTPENAYVTITRKEKERQDNIAYKKKKEAQAEQREAMDAAYKKMLVKIKAKSAANPKTILTYKGYALKDIVDLDKLIDKNNCLLSSTRKDSLMGQIGKNNFIIDHNLALMQYDFGFKPSDIEPHKRDKRFAYVYLLKKRINELVIQLAARHMICDQSETFRIQSIFMGKESLVNEQEWDEMVEYLENKK